MTDDEQSVNINIEYFEFVSTHQPIQSVPIIFYRLDGKKWR